MPQENAQELRCQGRNEYGKTCHRLLVKKTDKTIAVVCPRCKKTNEYPIEQAEPASR